MPRLTYSCEIFIDKIRQRRNLNRLESLRGLMARTITGAYATVSAEAAAVLANIPPLENLMEEHVDTRKHRRGLEINRDDFQIPAQPRLSKPRLAEALRSRTLDQWQQRWDETDKGRTTYEMIPNIQRRQNLEYSLNRKTTQILTGHGLFQKHSLILGKADDDIWPKLRPSTKRRSKT